MFSLEYKAYPNADTSIRSDRKPAFLLAVALTMLVAVMCLMSKETMSNLRAGSITVLAKKKCKKNTSLVEETQVSTVNTQTASRSLEEAFRLLKERKENKHTAKKMGAQGSDSSTNNEDDESQEENSEQ
uniref:Uncharacterized protein n=1 Tax=Fibrocapsa japonica TaxID=94617 RepID=A0A7S2UY85_9STRA|mmetsp:Transcript_20098/g.29059  ORF Transcript_20098/g.29059 Transcript_20098/m.29059 type:complete len:129 (+) Transcript_20098:127-513(+)